MNPGQPSPEPALSFRTYENPADLDLLLALGLPLATHEPTSDIVLAFRQDATDRSILVGYSELGRYSTFDGQKALFQIGHLGSPGRDLALWPQIIRENDRRLGIEARALDESPGHFLQAWASDREAEWARALLAEGYIEVRHFSNMVHPLEAIPDCPMTGGVVVRPVKAGELRTVWEAQREMNKGLFEGVADDWTEEAWGNWVSDPGLDPRMWQLAWADTRLVGMALARGSQGEPGSPARRRGFVEHIYVTPEWRSRGLARALICRGLKALAAEGFQEAELGVDRENRSGAFALYQGLGFKSESVDTWFRKEGPGP